MSYSVKPVAISDIYLDNENPRDEPIDNEPEIIENLLKKERVKNLAKDIAKHGTSPLERMATIEHPKARGKYIVVEGNRRLCALKLLLDPDRASKESDKKYFRELKATYPRSLTTKSIEAVVFDSREEARHWLELRHEGEQDGIGTRPWNPTQKARFNSQGNSKPNPNILATLVLDYAQAKGLISATQRDQISLTTLTRYLTNPIFRNTLGLKAIDKLEIWVPTDQFDTVIKRFLNDAVGGFNPDVNSRSKKVDRENYAHKLIQEQVAPTERTSEPIILDASTGAALSQASTAKTSKSSSTKNNRNPDTRPYVIPSDFKVHIKDRILKRLFDELRNLDANTFSFSAAYLLRAIIERTIKLFLQQKGIAYDAELHILCKRAEEKLSLDGVDKRKTKILRDMESDSRNKLSPETLGAWVHGSTVPTRTELNRRWDSIESILAILFAQLK